MKTTKKVLSVVLALILAFGVLAIVPFAKAPDSAIDLYIRTDKTNYKPGEIITFTVSRQVIPDVGRMRVGGIIPIAYNNIAIEPISDITDDLEPHHVKYLQPGEDLTGDTLYPYGPEGNDTGMEVYGAEHYGWNDSFIVGLCDDNGDTVFDNTDLQDWFSIEMKVKDNAPEGDYVIGFNQESYVNYEGICYDEAMGGVAGWDDDNGYNTTTNYSLGTCTVHVGSETSVEKSPLEQLKRFWRQTPGGKPDEDVQLKVRSTITRADLAKELKVEEPVLNAAIKSQVKYVGFAMAANNTIDDKDLILAAENVGKKVTGTKSGDIVAGLNNWVIDDNTNIQFGAVVDTTRTALATPAYYTAFIILNDNTVIRYTNPVEISAADLKA